MPVKWLTALFLLFPVILFANQENDLELFEFLALYEESDNIFIDAEMADKNESIEVNYKQNKTNQRVTKSESDE